MAKFFEALDDKLIAFIEAQPMFFIASAVAEGRVNLSPKGLDTFRVLGPQPLSPISTSPARATRPRRTPRRAAARPSCSARSRRNPLVLRLYGRTRVGAPGGALWRDMPSASSRCPARGRSWRWTSSPARPPAVSAFR